MQQAYVKGTDIRIVGTLESIQGTAIVDGFDANGDPVYEGGTDIDWNTQTTERNDKGQIIFVDENDKARSADEVEFRKDKENGEG